MIKLENISFSYNMGSLTQHPDNIPINFENQLALMKSHRAVQTK